MQSQIGYPSHYNYTKLWGTWNNFIEEMGIRADGHGSWLKKDIETIIFMYPNSSREDIENALINKYSWSHISQKARQLGLSRKYKQPSKKALPKEFLISEFWRFHREFGKYPLRKDLKENEGYPSESGYKRIWGTWDSFLKDIGVIDKNTTDGWYIVDENVLKEKYHEGDQQDIINSMMVKRTWGRIVVKANSMGLTRNKAFAHRKFNDENELIEMLRNLATKLGRTPRDTDIRKIKDFPSNKVFKDRFGSWNNALKIAGLKLNCNRDYTREQLIEEGKNFFIKNNRNPRWNELSYSNVIYKNYWSTWDEFLIECGLEITEKKRGFKTKEEAIDFLKKVHYETGEIPTSNLLSEKYNTYSDWYYINFGTFNKALYEAGLVTIEYTYSKEKLVEESLNILKELYENKGSSPTATEYDELVKNTAFLNRKALESNLNMKFGDICISYLGEANQYRKDNTQLLEELITLKEKLGRPPYIKELMENGLSSFTQYQRAFGKTFSELLVDLGWESELPYARPKHKSDDELLQDYYNLYITLDRIPFREDIDNEESMCSYSTYLYRFGSVKKILDILEIEYPTEIVDYSFGQGYTCFDKNGEICRSYDEMLITNFLIENNIMYIKEYPYNKVITDKKSKKRFDWFLPHNNLFIEYFGLFDENQLDKQNWIGKYARKVIEKIEICKNNKLTLIEIYPEDMNENNTFTQKINKYLPQQKVI
jgi:hypothetical protein